MRLWHKDLLLVLPRQQLLSQWRECCGAVQTIAEKGSPRHILINRIMDYPVSHFQKYVEMVLDVMKSRGYKVSEKSYRKYIDNLSMAQGKFITDQTENNLFADWHNDIYLRQCLYNLEEKYICGGIPDDEWQRVREKFTDYLLFSLDK